VDIRCSHRTQSGQLVRRLLGVEDVQWPVAYGFTLQVWVGESCAEVGADDRRFEAGGLLLRPRQRPDRIKPAIG
jgi:hypothetical protein